MDIDEGSYCSKIIPKLDTSSTANNQHQQPKMDSPTCPGSMISTLQCFSASPPTSPTNDSNDERPFKCPKPGCYQRFKRRFTLKEHIKTHTGEKPFSCPVKSCGKTFTTSGNLARHKRLHPWLKPLVCLVDGCDRSFSNELKLENHIKTHFKGPRELQTCPVKECGKQFSTTGNLTRHLKQQHYEMSQSDSDESCYHSIHPETSAGKTSPCNLAFGSGRMYHDASRAFNPLMNEVSDVSDEELLETLRCLF
jgi:uncharacterized Zn-finger protein